MANRVIRVLPRSLFDLSGLGLGGKAGLTLARRVEVSEFTELTAYIRFHPGTQVDHAPSVASLVFDADGYTDEDPGSLYLPSGQPPYALSFQTIKTFSAFPLVNTGGAMRVLAIPSGFGSLLSIGFVVTANAATTGTLQYVFSIDLVGKNSDPGDHYVKEREPLLSEVMD